MKKRMFAALCAVFATIGAAWGAEMPRFVHALTIHADAKGGILNRPEGVACRGEMVVVADTENGRLVRFSLAKAGLGGGEEIREARVPSPVRVQIDSQSRILVLDGKLRQVVRLSPEGKFLDVIASAGGKGGQIIARSFALGPRDEIHILDSFGGRVLRTDAAGAVQGEIPLPPAAGFISDLTVDQAGTIYLLDSVNAAVYSAGKEDPEFKVLAKSLKEYMNFPTYFSADGRGGLYVVDRNGSGIVLLGTDGTFRGRQLTMGWKPGLLYYPSQIAFSGGDEALIADRDNSRVQVFRLVK